MINTLTKTWLKHFLKHLRNNKVYFIILIIATIHMLFLWPGLISQDSQSQYEAAMSGIYNDHHPALMSFVWRYLDKIYKGSGLMFALQLVLFYGGIFYLIKSIENYKCKYYLLLLPFIPQIFIYSSMVWKDVGFSFSFLFVAAYLAYLTSIKKQPNIIQAFVLLIILFYGTAIKFQAQYCAPILLFWLLYAYYGYQVSVKKFILSFLIVSLTFYTILNTINSKLLPNPNKKHSWQSVKGFDLAAISIYSNNDLLPNFIKNKNFSFIEMSKRLDWSISEKYVYYMTDVLYYPPYPNMLPILKMINDPEGLKQLYLTWLKAVKQHPFFYFKHRSINMISMLLYHPAFKYAYSVLQLNSDSLLYPLINFIIYATMSSLIPVMLCFAYLIYGLFLLLVKDPNDHNWFHVPLIFFNAIGATMIIVLFFCSLAGTPRYTYITICLTHASHIFAYLSYKHSRVR